ncbi:CvpA family protein [Cupriavidus agavae]|uniref:Membrane protein required for colicin V production n=1 Tax=Cupriavidus agavae TaxID=1001822 RepID=A0A4Q7S5J1_9BURK|nr:CvpA family protein [Cupriavidus agavae]RZT41605.1 membrane protein required for colicin V production [Cupriavidus agavae]
MEFTYFDYAVGFILLASALLGLLRGLVREMLALVGWVVAFLLAFHFGEAAAQYMPESLPGGSMTRTALGFLSVFFGTWIVAALAGAVATRALETTGLKPADRGLGLVFGLARGGLIVILVVVLASLTKLPEEPFWRNAVSRPYVMQGMEEFRQWLPPDLAKYVKI